MLYNRKMITGILVIVMFFAVFTFGCGSVKDNPQSDSSAPGNTSVNQETIQEPTANNKDATITISASQNWIKDIDKEINDGFTRETGIKVDLQVNPNDQYSNIIKTKLATGEGPDIFMVSAGVAAYSYLPEKNFMDLTNEPWVSRLEEWARTSSTIDGKLVGLNTWSRDGWGILYNTDIFSKYNLSVPKSYQEFINICETLKSNGINPIYEPAQDAWHPGEWLLAMGSEANNRHPGLYDKLNNNQAKFADVVEFEEVLKQLKEIADKGYMGKDYMSDLWDKSYEAMGTGKSAMILTYSTYQNEVEEKYPESKAKKWKMFHSPLGDSQSYSTSAGGIMRVVNKNTKNMGAVREYMNYITRVENLEKYYTGSPFLGETSFTDVKGEGTAAFESAIANSTGKVGIDLVGGVLYYDESKTGTYVQELLLNAKTPKEVLEAIDRDRQKMFDAIAK